MRKHSRNIVLLLLFIGVIVALRLSGVGDFLTLENLQKNRDTLIAAVKARFLLSLIVFIAVYIVVTAFSIPGAAVLTLAGGFLFGTLPAVVSVNLGATGGAVLAFLSARYLIGTRIQSAYGKQLERFNAEMERNGNRYLLTLRLLPVFPFFLVNFLSGLTRVPLTTFAWTTSLGIIPGSLVYSFAGSQIESVHSLGDILTAKILLSFGLLALFTLAPAVIGRMRKRPSPPAKS